MKKTIYFIALLIITSVPLITGCNDSTKNVDQAKADMEEAAKILKETKEKFQLEYLRFKIESSDRISKNEKTILELREIAKTKEKKVKDEMEKVIAELELKNEAMKAKANEYQSEGANKWESFKIEFDHDMTALANALEDLTNKNTSTNKFKTN
ncbi:MAG: hypothetical protein KJ941_07670 [Bacteroidetes bacterium]|nr:hypothetical protein [Bacteroidota bacterium]